MVVAVPDITVDSAAGQTAAVARAADTQAAADHGSATDQAAVIAAAQAAPVDDVRMTYEVRGCSANQGKCQENECGRLRHIGVIDLEMIAKNVF